VVQKSELFLLSFSSHRITIINYLPYLKESTSVQQPSSIMSSQRQQQQQQQPKPTSQLSLPPLPPASTDNERMTSIDSQVYFEGGDDGYDDYDDFSPSTSGGGGGAQTKRQDQRGGSGGSGTIYSAKHVRQKEAQLQQQQKPKQKGK
jgi:hypothetical protein